MQKNHRKFLEKSLVKKQKNISDQILDDYEAFDVYQEEKDEDNQYQKLLRDTGDYKKPARAHDFDEDPLYSGRKVSKKEMYDEADEDEIEDDDLIEEDEDDEEEISDEDDTQQDKKPTNLEKFDIDEILEDINKQDKEVLKNEQNKEEELKKARAVKDQYNLLDNLIEARVKMQDILKSANRFPHSSAVPTIESQDKNGQIRAIINDIQCELVDLIDLIEETTVEYHSVTDNNNVLTKRRRMFNTHKFMKTEKINKQKFDKLYVFDTDKLWKHLDSNFENQLPQLDKIITNWAQKFNILNQSSLKGKFANIFQTPVQQAQKAMEDYDRLLKRSQVRDITSKVFFDSEEKGSSYDEEIYNDDDFYVLLFKEMLQKQGQNNTASEEHDGLLVDNTRLYLKNKLLQAKPKKDVDRRASKNRKVRFEVHQKLINFVAPIENTYLLPGRDHILRNLFGLYEKPEEVQKEEIPAKKVNKTGNQPVIENNEDDIKLF